jgi:hypothetical protein
VHNTYFNDLEDFATEHRFALRLNYRTSMEQSYHLLFIGIGAADIRPERTLSDQNGDAIALTDTGSSHLYPLVQVGGVYMKRILPNSGFYLGLEACLQYVSMHSENRYYLQQPGISVPATIGGDVVSPGISIKLLYIFDGVERH